ncbi:MAG: helix-turn-helix domain-containing protein [Candidatus Aenigmatarchaeota archaeon]
MLRCERFYKLLPSIRAMIAKELVINHGFSQEEVARIMNVTQGAISQYIRRKRGKKFEENKIISKLIKEFCENLKKGSNFDEELCKLCMKINQEILSL